MIPRRVFLTASTVLALLSAGDAVAQVQSDAAQLKRQKLFASETMNIGGGVALSPNGRWLVLAIMETPGKSSLWMQEAGTAAPYQLTASGYFDGLPQWSTQGDRLYFVSNRTSKAGDPGYYLMVLPFEPATGRVLGQPKQATDDPTTAFRVSPDGKQVAYFDFRSRRQLKVAPTGGGPARLVVQTQQGSSNLAWSADGQSLLYVMSSGPQRLRTIQRVALSGGEPVVVTSAVPNGLFTFVPGGERYLIMDATDQRQRTLKLLKVDGQVVQTMVFNRNTRPVHFTPDGQSLVAIENNVSAQTRVVTLTDGKYRDLTSENFYDWVLGFAPDHKSVFTWTMQKGIPVLGRISLTGAARTFYADTGQWHPEGANSKYIFLATKRDGAQLRTLVALDTRTNRRQTITKTAYPSLFPLGPGGTFGVQEALLYLEQSGDQVQVREWLAPGKSRTIRTVPRALLDHSNIAVHGDRVAWQQPRDNDLDLMIAEGSATPRRLLTYPNTASTSINEISFSPDGNKLVLHYATAANPLGDQMAIVDPAGRAEPRILNTGASYWYWARWLPDNTAVAVIAGGTGDETNVVSLSLQEGAKPVNLSKGDPTSKWGFEISLDGSMIAYPHETWRGSTVWKIDLGSSVAVR